MKLSELKVKLQDLNEIRFALPDGKLIPEHFHVTEIGQINKKFIDCGGTKRNESVINFQLWTSNDYDHRISADKLKSIIELSEKNLMLEDYDIEVEYQAETIGKYELDIEGQVFQLRNKHTDCLAKDNCGIPKQKPLRELSSNTSDENTCLPGTGCC